MRLADVMDLRRVGSSLAGKFGSYIRVVILAVAVSFTGDISSAQDLDKGFTAYQRGDFQTALKELLPLATLGHAGAQNSLGYMYSNGEGVLTDYMEAVRLYRLAADQGDANAQYNLGLMYKNGKSVPTDNEEAVQ